MKYSTFMLIRLLAALAVVLVVAISLAEAGCPIGSFETRDSWGNRICKDISTGSPRTIEGNIYQCPPGTYSQTDSWGNLSCRSFGSEDRYYDPSRGCPTGSYPWVDRWGNQTCKFF